MEMAIGVPRGPEIRPFCVEKQPPSIGGQRIVDPWPSMPFLWFHKEKLRQKQAEIDALDERGRLAKP